MMIARCQAEPLMRRLLISLIVSALSIRPLPPLGYRYLQHLRERCMETNLPISGAPCRARERNSNIRESCYLVIWFAQRRHGYTGSR